MLSGSSMFLTLGNSCILSKFLCCKFLFIYNLYLYHVFGDVLSITLRSYVERYSCPVCLFFLFNSYVFWT